jgi:hypothetical protein
MSWLCASNDKLQSEETVIGMSHNPIPRFLLIHLLELTVQYRTHAWIIIKLIEGA